MKSNLQDKEGEVSGLYLGEVDRFNKVEVPWAIPKRQKLPR